MRKQVLVLLLMLTLLAPVFGTGCVEDDGDEETQTIIDMAGREVKVPTKVDRVVGIEAGALRLLVYLECSSTVVGVEETEKTSGEKPYIMAHPELANLSSIGPIHGGEAELIVAAEPDVIFWTYTTAQDANELQEKTQTPVVVLDYGDLGQGKDNFYEALRLVARVMDKEERAEEFVTFMESTMAELRQLGGLVPAEDRSTVYVGGIGYRGAHGILSTEPAYTSFGLLEADNVAGDLGYEHAFIDKEQLLEWDPEYVFVDEGGYDLVIADLKNDDTYQELLAVKNGTLYGLLPYNWYTTNYGTVLANTYYLGSVLYPEHFAEIDPEAKADEIYEFMVGERVYQQMAEHFRGFKQIQLDDE